MCGWSTRIVKNGPKVRYYCAARHFNAPQTNEPFRRLLRADLIEANVFSCLTEVINDVDGLHELIRQHLQAALKERQADDGNLAALVSEKEQVEQKYKMILHDLGSLGRELCKQEAAQLEARHKSLLLRIKQATTASLPSPSTASGIVESLKHQLKDVGTLLTQHDIAPVRRLLGLMVSKLEYNLETNKMVLEIAVPSWALSKEHRLLELISMVPSTATTSGHDTTAASSAVVLGEFECTLERAGRHTCMTCRRHARAPGSSGRRRGSHGN
jgi:hypothetical protein